MNKQTFTEILQCCLLSFDEVSQEQMVQEYGLNPKLVMVGVQLCSYLKAKEIAQ